MRTGQYFALLFLAIVCMGLGVAVLATSWENQRLQGQLQAQQLVINNGVLGVRGQQISGQLLQEMTDLAARDSKMKALLEKYGYAVQGAQASPASPEPAGKIKDGPKMKLLEDTK